jgi:putative RNA 2'-phosphotransferase
MLDENGWTNVELLLAKLKQKGFDVSTQVLVHVVETNNKKRFAFNEDMSKIRAARDIRLTLT